MMLMLHLFRWASKSYAILANCPNVSLAVQRQWQLQETNYSVTQQIANHLDYDTNCFTISKLQEPYQLNYYLTLGIAQQLIFQNGCPLQPAWPPSGASRLCSSWWWSHQTWHSTPGRQQTWGTPHWNVVWHRPCTPHSPRSHNPRVINRVKMVARCSTAETAQNCCCTTPGLSCFYDLVQSLAANSSPP